MARRRLLQSQQIHKVALSIAGAGFCAAVGFQVVSSLSGKNSGLSTRTPAGTAITEYSPEQIAKAEWSVSTIDFENSDPGRGRSYFDYVFSKLTPAGDKRVYDVPYPFEKAMDRINQYMGYAPNDSGLKVVLFPMGRSLQRNAALIDSPTYDLNLFFRFPRIVVGIDQEPKRPFALNLKGRLFMGFHEKSKVIEAISYNDSEGRYEYQVVRDYEAGKVPTVVYANRQLCLSCHQNQTPIFSKSPWNESNAHAEIIARTESAMRASLGEPPCDGSHAQIYCSETVNGQKKLKYFGAPTSVDLNAPYALDTLAGQGNYSHALQKLWLNLCADLECKQTTLKMIVRYLLNGEGVRLADKTAASTYLQKFEQSFQTRFPSGLKLPDPKIPNRDPLKDPSRTQSEIERSSGAISGVIKKDLKNDLQDLITRSTVPAELEPLTIRPPLELWTSTEPDGRNMNKMISGFADFFTQEDIRALDRWMALAATKKGFPEVQNFSATCQVQQMPQDDGLDVQVTCPPGIGATMALQTGYFAIRKNRIQQSVVDNLFFYPNDNSCDRRAPQTVANRASGLACPAFQHGEATGTLQGDLLRIHIYRSNGVHARLIDGRLLSMAQLNIKTGEFSVQILDDMKILDAAIEANAFIDPVYKKTSNAPFNRKALLKSFAQAFGVKMDDPDVQGKMSTLEKNLEVHTITEEELLGQVKNPVDAFTHSCSMCHYNFEGVPPAFLGLKQNSIDSVGKCQRIEACAPRILYRLKMRNCAPEKVAAFKKSPMPMDIFFSSAHVEASVWQKKISPVLIGMAQKLVRPSELTQYLQSQGVDAAKASFAVNELLSKDCPDVDFTTYESLPRCEFSHLRSDSICPSLMQSYGN